MGTPYRQGITPAIALFMQEGSFYQLFHDKNRLSALHLAQLENIIYKILKIAQFLKCFDLWFTIRRIKLALFLFTICLYCLFNTIWFLEIWKSIKKRVNKLVQHII